LINKLLLILCVALCTLLLPVESFSQTVVTILSADRTQAVQSSDGTIRKLTGNVELQTPDVRIRADSAWHYVNLGEIHGFGNLEIETGSEIIWADLVIYDINAEISSLSGNVIIRTETVDIYSQKALYNFLGEIALFNEPIWLKDESGIMRADEGVYFSQSDSVIFRGNVQIADSTQYIEADSLFSNRKSGDYRLFGNVFMLDEENRSRIRGDYVEADSTGRRIVEGNAILHRVSEDFADTTWLNAGSIYMSKIDTFYVIDALERVLLWHIDYSAVADSAHFNEQIEMAALRHDPVVWYQNIQLTGDIIDIQFRNDSLETVFATGMPFTVQQDSISGRYNQMKGDELLIRFNNGAVQNISIDQNGELLLHATDEQDKPDGAINVRGSTIIIHFEGGEADRMQVHQGVDGEVIEESDQIPDIRLGGFMWNPERRPHRPDEQLLPRHPEIPAMPPFVRSGVSTRKK
jgi:lipopolysaccharide export system protein LptA